MPTGIADSYIVRTEEYVRKYMASYNDSSHDWEHVNRVRRCAVSIASHLLATDVEYSLISLEVVELAALLHDVGDFKFQGSATNSTAAVKTLGEFLASQEFPESISRAIQWIVPRVSFRSELKDPSGCLNGPYVKELWCVQDADRLDAIGAIGIARCFSYNGARNLPLYEPQVTPLANITEAEYNAQTCTGRNSNARNHFYEKLFKLEGMMKTTIGKQLAYERNNLMKQFIRQLEKECGLPSYHIN
jgi:uncharacterized protein